jgi:hypothetical protein
MLKKLLGSVTLLLCCLLIDCGQLFAEEDKSLTDESLPNENLTLDLLTQEYFKSEEPLNQKDIDYYIKAVTLFAHQDAEKELVFLAKIENIPKKRIQYIFSKVGIAYILAENPGLKEEAPYTKEFSDIFPTEEEMEIVRQNYWKISSNLRKK